MKNRLYIMLGISDNGGREKVPAESLGLKQWRER